MKQQFSVAYIHARAAMAGCSIKRHDTDYDGVDITVSSSADYGKIIGAEIEIQLKCTSRKDLVADDHVKWKLECDRLALIANPRRFQTAYLGVLVVPEDPTLWLDYDEDTLMGRSIMYWVKATDLGMPKPGKKTQVVHVPKSVFTPSALLHALREVSAGDYQ
ncbi:hypothetical protein ABH926_007076 [Catenulispora sp. GP43]|uniref:DUF4365 domain-containing protein n=1 Tax=Catenulispora sp. GP43 TaxID=3156263 RepID=UPI003513F3B1